MVSGDTRVSCKACVSTSNKKPLLDVPVRSFEKGQMTETKMSF